MIFLILKDKLKSFLFSLSFVIVQFIPKHHWCWFLGLVAETFGIRSTPKISEGELEIASILLLVKIPEEMNAAHMLIFMKSNNIITSGEDLEVASILLLVKTPEEMNAANSLVFMKSNNLITFEEDLEVASMLLLIKTPEEMNAANRLLFMKNNGGLQLTEETLLLFTYNH